MPTRRGTKSGAEPAARRRSRAALGLSLQFADAAHRPLLPRHRVARWLRAALAAPAELTVRIVGAEEGRALNREYRGKDYATNVLTFDYQRAPTVRRRHRAVRAGGRARGRRAGHRARGALRPPARARRAACAGLRPRARRRREGDGGARERDRASPSASPIPTPARPAERCAAPAACTEAIASSTRTIAAPSCQCSCSFSHHAPETTPSTGIIITDMLEATGGRLRAMHQPDRLGEAEDQHRVVGDRAPGRRRRRGPAVALEQQRRHRHHQRCSPASSRRRSPASARAIRVRRICCVPSAQTAAANSMPTRGQRPAGQGAELVPEQQRDADRGGGDAGEHGAAAAARRTGRRPRAPRRSASCSRGSPRGPTRAPGARGSRRRARRSCW